MAKTMTTLERIQAWYLGQCDGDWEHGYGIHIETLDNPGWSVDIALDGTSLEEREFHPIRIERAKDDWLLISNTPIQFKIRCGPNNLEEGLTIFCNWAEV